MRYLFFLLIILCGCNQFEVKTYDVEVTTGSGVEKFKIKSRGAPDVKNSWNDLIITGNFTGESVRVPGPVVKSITEEKVLGEINGSSSESMLK